jgi:hypothetical protein
MNMKSSSLHVNVAIALKLLDHPTLFFPFPFNRSQNENDVENALETLVDISTGRDPTIVSSEYWLSVSNIGRVFVAS